MSRYIDVDLLLEKLKSTPRYFSVKFDIENAPTEEVKPIVYGEWIEHKNVEQANGEIVYECSNCGVYSRKEFFCEKNFCPNCGAKMKGEEK